MYADVMNDLRVIHHVGIFFAHSLLRLGRLNERSLAMLGTILLVVLVLLLLGALPTWPHSRSWGYFPTGGLGLVVLILLILLVLGRI